MAEAVFFLLALFIVTFSLGGGLLILTLLTYQKLGNRAFRDGAFIVISGMALTIAAGLPMIWSLVGSGAPSPPMRAVSLALTVIGNSFMALALPRLAFRILGKRVSAPRWIFHILLAAASVALGVLKEITDAHALEGLDKICLLLIHGYATTYLLLHFKEIGDALLRSVLKVYFLVFTVWLALMAGQIAVVSGIPADSIWSDAPVGQLLYQIAMSVLILYCAARYIYKPDPVPGSILSRDFVARFGISNRESEIISLIIQGYNNNKIGEKLFISTRTVKNHVYNIYQKTKVENKVQLMNLIRSNGLL